jgi:biotin-(acetyl-CoA carboxylase) ligase
MPLATRTGFTPELTLPPPYSAVRLREWGNALAQAVTLAPQRGAGTLVYVGRFDAAEFAVVLEPSESLAQARRVFYAGMVALADALAGAAPPETAIHIEWPDALYVNWGLVGGGCLAWPQRAAENKTPEWMVFGATIRAASTNNDDPGVTPNVTTLDEEGFAETGAVQMIESFARNFMHAVDAWHERGFVAVKKSYLERFSRDGMLGDIDDNGDLLIRHTSESTVERSALLPRLVRPSWRNLLNEGPRR